MNLIEYKLSSEDEEASTLLINYELVRTENFSLGKKITTQQNLDSMAAIAVRIQNIAPNSFSAAYVNFKEAGFSETSYELLKTAESLTYNKKELFFRLFSHYSYFR